MKKSTKNKIKKAAKKVSTTTKVICALLFILFACGGAFAVYTVTKNDTFELIGESLIELNVGDDYIEQGAKAIAFGKDISSEVKVKGIVNTQVEGEYLLKYTVDNFRFKGYTLYRKVVVKVQV